MHSPRISATAPGEDKGPQLYSEITRARRDLRSLELASEMKHFPFKSKTSVRTEKRHLEGVLGLSGQKFFLLQVLGFLSPPLDNIDVRIPLAMDECSVWSRACVQVSRPCCSLKNSISESSGCPSGILSHISSLFLLLWMPVEATPHWRYDSYRLPLFVFSEALKIVCSSQT